MSYSQVFALSRRILIPAMGIGLLAAPSGHGATPRCDLVGIPKTVAGGGLERACLDLSRLQGDTLTIPGNVTRIAQQGLALCKGAVKEGGLADIAYVLDQSISMYASYLWVRPGTQDTTFFQGLDGCNTMHASDTVAGAGGRANILFEDGGTQTVKVLKSSVSIQGCHSFAGDPYGQRGIAFKNAIQYQSELSPTSTAGYLGFNYTVSDAVKLLPLTSANVQTLKNKIVMRRGGTVYGDPLDSAKKWLNNPALTKTNKQAIIFLSDGKPTDNNYLNLLGDGKMPPIYGIFLGNPTADFSKLKQLSDTTGGEFYLIPPGNPDSLKTVVKIILNQILKTFTPVSATLTNNSLSPAQISKSLSADFTPQGEASWLIRLDEIIGLAPSGINRMSLETRFQESSGGGEEIRTIQFALRTDGTPATASKILSDSLFAISCYEPSQISLLTATGQRVAQFTEKDSLPKIALRTSPDLASSHASLTQSLLLKDSLPVTLAKSSAGIDSSVYAQTFSLTAGMAARTKPNSLEAKTFDTLTAFWKHPRDAQDTASARIPVVAANQGSLLRFSLTDGGPAASRIPPDKTQVFLILDDQPSPSGSRTVTVTSSSLGLDSEIFSLTEVSPGHFQGAASIKPGVKNSNDGYLQVSPGGDQLRAIYRDPVYGDSAIAQTGFDEAPQEPATLVFVKANGDILPDGATISPQEMAGLKLQFGDDYALGSVTNKNAEFSLLSTWANQAFMSDSDTLSMPLTGTPSDTRAIWTLTVPLFESGSATSGDKRLNFRFLGQLTAQVNAHDNTGAQEIGKATATLKLAYADANAQLQWSQTDTSGLGGASVEALRLVIQDQDYAPGGKDSTLLHVLCPVTGDSLTLIAKENQAGNYGPAVFGRNKAGANPQDAWLSCPDGSDILVKHIDPIHGDVSSWILPQVATPVFDPSSKSFRISQKVGLSTATDAARLVYTLDGSLPDSAHGTVYTDPLTLIANTTMAAIGLKTGYRNSQTLIQTYSKVRTASSLTLLDANGLPIANHRLSDAATGLVVKVTTSQGGLTEVKPTLHSLHQGDMFEIRLLDIRQDIDALIYMDPLALNLGAPQAGNDTLEIANEDTVVAIWVNPLDPTDIARDTVIIKPRYLQPVAYFTTVRNGPRASLYPADQDSVYILVDSRSNLSGAVAEVVSKQLGIDRETVMLTEVSPGRYAGALPLLPAGLKTSQNGSLSVALAGDQLVVTFVDPIYGDSGIGNAGYAEGVEETGQLFFVDLEGKPLAPGANWNPDARKVAVVFRDDWSLPIAGSVESKTVTLVLLQWKNGELFAADSEAVVIHFDTNAGTLGEWRGEVVLEEAGKTAKPGDGKLQTAYLGKLTGEIATHDNSGTADGGKASARLTIAHPDQEARLKIVDEKGETPHRPSQELHITLEDGLQSTAGQPLLLTLSCLQSGDTLVVQLQTQDSGTSWSATASKGEGKADPSDGMLTCAIEDQLVGSYQDPTHGTKRMVEITWTDPVMAELYFTRVGDKTPILTLFAEESGQFEVHVIAQSPTLDRADVIVAQLTGPQGESEDLNLEETGAFTGHFVGKIPFAFSLKNPQAGNGVLNLLVDLSKDNPLAVVEGTQGKAHNTLSLKTKVIRVLAAAIRDQNRDGKADGVSLRLATPADMAPTDGITASWDKQEDKGQRQISRGDIRLTASGLGMMADAQSKPWDYGKTRAEKPQPKVVLPPAAPWFGQTVSIEDSLGPIPLSAMKKPSDLKSIEISEFERRFNPDTLILTLSEPLKSLTSLKNMVRFSSGCTGYDQSQTVMTYGEPKSDDDRVVWTILVDNSPTAKLPLTGDCLYLEGDGRYTDDFSNSPLPLGIAITGENPRLAIRLVQGYPPVAGVDARDPAFLLANSDVRTDRTGRFTRESGGDWNVLWVPPTGFNPQDPMSSYIPSSPSEEPRSGGETTYPSPMPSQIGVVQVATTGRYVAQVSIFDNTGHFVRNFKQAFGYRGELRNPYRSSEKGMLSFLIWDLKDKSGAKAGQGVYIWRINFAFADGKQEVQVVKTGVLR